VEPKKEEEETAGKIKKGTEKPPYQRESAWVVGLKKKWATFSMVSEWKDAPLT